MGFSWSEIERSLWGRAAIWLAFAAALGVAPLLFRGGLAMTILSQAGYVIIICLSYNILFGQGGMLSFGHAVYTGFGALIAMHAMRMAGTADGWSVPLPLIPLAGGLAGGFMAVLFGYVTTKKIRHHFRDDYPRPRRIGRGDVVDVPRLLRWRGWRQG